MGTVELAVREEERFWTEQLTIGLRTLDVAVALQAADAADAADAALQLHRFMWTRSVTDSVFRLMRRVLATRCIGTPGNWKLAPWLLRSCEGYLPGAIWSAAFAKEWAESSSLVAAATQADSALEGYARKIGVEVPTLFADGDGASKASWRSVWDAMHRGRTSASG